MDMGKVIQVRCALRCLYDGTWGCIRQWLRLWRNHMAQHKHPKYIALQECSPNRSLPQLVLFFSDMRS